MISPDFLRDCIEITVRRSVGSPIYPTTPLPDPPLGAHTHPGAHSDFYGIPSNPISIYHTGDLCPKLIDPDAWRVSKETWPICKHPIASVWRELGRQVYEYFDSVAVKWTSIDPVRFAEVGRNAQAGPLFLWVGVMPGTLSHDDAEVAAVGCKDILAQSQITDVEIAFRESVFTRSAGPQLLDYISHIDPNVDVRGPFTPALGLQIAGKATPHIEGTGGLYICEGGESDRVFVLTTRHVVFPPSAYRNDLYSGKKKGQPHPGVILLGSRAYQGALKSIMGNIGHQAILIECYNDELEGLGEAVDIRKTHILLFLLFWCFSYFFTKKHEKAQKSIKSQVLVTWLFVLLWYFFYFFTKIYKKAEKSRKSKIWVFLMEGEDATQGKKREKVKVKMKEAEKSIEILDEFHGMNTKLWSAESQRVVGHVAYAPPISVGTGDKCYTEDWALIELHREKINDWKGFKGNVFRLGTYRSILPKSSNLNILSRNQNFAR